MEALRSVGSSFADLIYIAAIIDIARNGGSTMVKQSAWFVLLLSTAFLIASPPCWAKSKGYLYVISYSLAQKRIFLSQVITQNVRDKSFNDEEYVSDIDLLQKMEAQFQQHLASVADVDTSAYTAAARGAYKTRAIADRHRNKEKERYLKRGFTVKVLSDFKYSD
jgi:hypothetical protein